MKKPITWFIVLGLLVLSGCTALAPSPTATPTPTEVPEPPLAQNVTEIIGRWSLGAGPRTIFFQFDESGAYVMALGVITNLEDSPQHFGPFLFEGGTLTFVTSDESPVCPGQRGTYEVRLLEQGQLALNLVEDECSLRGNTNLSPLVPLSP